MGRMVRPGQRDLAVDGARLMPNGSRPHPFSVPTIFKGRVNVKCPICGHEEFLTSEPEDMELVKEKGFRHVIVGMFGNDQFATQPVRFQHCANCGYVLQFVFGKFPQGKQEEQS
jgi:hypothetical protein